MKNHDKASTFDLHGNRSSMTMKGSDIGIKQRYPFTSDFLDTLFIEQGECIDHNYAAALDRFLLNTSDDGENVKQELEIERAKFYEEFSTQESRIKAFSDLGGIAANPRILEVYLPALHRE